jgi:prepilin-type N-terminal cleavage/methylation domain-containing protein
MKRTAFTLVELLVAIALVLVLMVGVNQVFRTTTATVAANQAVSDNTREARGAQSVFAQDFDSYASDGACMLILNCTQAAYRNRADELSDRDGNKLTIDVDASNTEGDPGVAGETISPALVLRARPVQTADGRKRCERRTLAVHRRRDFCGVVGVVRSPSLT